MPPTSLIVRDGSSEDVPKLTPHRPRIGRKTIPNGPECSRHPPRRVSKWFRDHFGAQIDTFTFLKQKKRKDHHIEFVSFPPIFGSRLEPENRPKSPLCPKRRPQRRCQKRFLCPRCFFELFLPFKANNGPKIKEKMKVFFRFCVRFFQARASQILCTGAVF